MYLYENKIMELGTNWIKIIKYNYIKNNKLLNVKYVIIMVKSSTKMILYILLFKLKPELNKNNIILITIQIQLNSIEKYNNTFTIQILNRKHVLKFKILIH